MSRLFRPSPPSLATRFFAPHLNNPGIEDLNATYGLPGAPSRADFEFLAHTSPQESQAELLNRDTLVIFESARVQSSDEVFLEGPRLRFKRSPVHGAEQGLRCWLPFVLSEPLIEPWCLFVLRLDLLYFNVHTPSLSNFGLWQLARQSLGHLLRTLSRIPSRLDFHQPDLSLSPRSGYDGEATNSKATHKYEKRPYATRLRRSRNQMKRTATSPSASGALRQHGLSASVVVFNNALVGRSLVELRTETWRGTAHYLRGLRTTTEIEDMVASKWHTGTNE